jgi:hypothetical protein
MVYNRIPFILLTFAPKEKRNVGNNSVKRTSIGKKGKSESFGAARGSEGNGKREREREIGREAEIQTYLCGNKELADRTPKAPRPFSQPE